MYKQLEIQQYLLLYYYTSSQFCKNYNTGILYIKRNHYSFSHDFFFLFKIMIHHQGPSLPSQDHFPIYCLSWWQYFPEVTRRNWGKFCIHEVSFLDLGRNLVNESDLAKLVAVTADELLVKIYIKNSIILSLMLLFP